MGLRKRLADLFWPPEVEGEEPEEEAPPSPPPTGAPGGLGDRLKRVGISEERRQGTRHQPAPVWVGHRTEASARTGPSLRQRLQQVGVPDLDAKELARQQRILEAGREAETRALRAAAHERVAATCPLPIHAERVPLPGGLRLLDDEFLVASSSRPTRNRDLTLTTQRLIYTRGRDSAAQLVVYLADICDLVFHGDGTLTVGTPSGRWERLPIAGNSVAASRDRLLGLVHHARAQRSALPGGLDELVELRETGAVGSGEYEARRAATTASSRRRREARVEVSGRATTRAGRTGEAEAPPGGGEEG